MRVLSQIIHTGDLRETVKTIFVGRSNSRLHTLHNTEPQGRGRSYRKDWNTELTDAQVQEQKGIESVQVQKGWRMEDSSSRRPEEDG